MPLESLLLRIFMFDHTTFSAKWKKIEGLESFPICMDSGLVILLIKLSVYVLEFLLHCEDSTGDKSLTSDEIFK